MRAYVRAKQFEPHCLAHSYRRHLGMGILAQPVRTRMYVCRQCVRT